MKTQVELLKECCDIKDAACVEYQKRIAELEKENKILKIELGMYQSLFKDKIEPYGCGIWEKVTEEDIEKAIKKYFNTNQK